MSRKLIIGGFVLTILVGALFGWKLLQADPADAAAGFLKRLAEQDFSELEDCFNLDGRPAEGELSGAFREFADAFALSAVEIAAFAPAAENRNEAVFSVKLNYKSAIFDDLAANFDLTVKRQNMFAEWKLEWADDLPLPGSGIAARYSRVRLDAPRGAIVDSSGHILAGAGSLVTVGVQPDRITEPELLLEALEEQLGLRAEYVQSQYEAPGVQGHWFIPLINLSESEYLRVDAALRPIPGIFFRRREARAYPLRQFAAHITGYLGEVTPAMIKTYPERDYASGEVAGRAGLESSQDNFLRGRPGYRFYVEPEEGASILAAERPAVPGETVQLTLDTKMQEVAYQILGERSGALVVLDAQSGAILALASTPSYDPNEFVRGFSEQRWEELSGDPGLPMFNRALQGLYPPGSAFKVLTVAAAVDQGLYSPDSLFTDRGELLVEGNAVRNFKRQVFGEHDLHTAVVESINTTVAQVGLDLGADLFESYFKKWGLAENVEVGLPAVRGQVGTPGRSKAALAWSSIGQDQVLVTPLHMALFFSVFANGGRLPEVHLLKAAKAKEAAAAEVLKNETVEQINAVLRAVVQDGTGKEARGTGLELYAKTGTAEVAGAEEHAWFAGHVQIPDGRRLAFALLVEEGGVGGQVAAPLMREYFIRLLE